MLDRHHQLTGSFLHDHYSVIAINAIFLTILDGNGTQDMRVADSLQWHALYVWNAGVQYKVQCGHADSWEWHVWYAWNAGVRDSSEWNARNVENA